jgi:hypothetical protein
MGRKTASKSTVGYLKSGANFSTKGGLGYVALDDAIELIYFEKLNETGYTEEEIKEQQDFLDRIDMIANKYLNSKEKCIYNLVIHEKKRTSEITIILNYNGWRTTQNSIDRVFKILNLYSDYEAIDKIELAVQIDDNFNRLEKRVLALLDQRLTIQEINKKLGKKFHYTKTHSLIKSIMTKLKNVKGASYEYYVFLTEIRKFKDSCRFDEKEDNVQFVGDKKR